MLIQRSAVKRGKGKIIRRKVAGHPVKNDVQPGGVRGVDKVTEIVTSAETAGRCIEAGRLIAPAAVERVFVNRQQLEMGEAHPFRVGDQLVGQLAVAQPEIIVGMAAPGAEMHFIDRDRGIKLVRRSAVRRLFHFGRQVADKRGAFRTHLRLKGVRVGFDPQVAVGVNQFEFIQLAIVRAGNEQLPDPGLFAESHRVASAVPVVKLPHHRDAAGVRRPHRETGAGNAVHGGGMRAQRFVRAQVGPFRQQPDVKILQQRTKAIRVINQILLSVPGDGQLIAKGVFTPRQNAAEKTTRVEAFELADFASGFWFNNPHIGGIG